MVRRTGSRKVLILNSGPGWLRGLQLRNVHSSCNRKRLLFCAITPFSASLFRGECCPKVLVLRKKWCMP
ncbi:hypothetical protein Hanom_Chr13g01183911 [Helianthus anomalus]